MTSALRGEGSPKSKHSKRRFCVFYTTDSLKRGQVGGGQKSENFADVIVANKHVKSCDTFLSQRQAEEGSDTTFVLVPDKPHGFVT